MRNADIKRIHHEAVDRDKGERYVITLTDGGTVDVFVNRLFQFTSLACGECRSTNCHHVRIIDLRLSHSLDYIGRGNR